METLLILFIATIILNILISASRKENWSRWVILSIIIGPLSLPFQLFCRETIH